jgi:amidase
MDAAVLLGAMTGVDERDPATAASAGKFFKDYSTALQPGDLKGIRIGVARNFFDSHPEVDQVIENCLPALKELGAELIDPANIETASKLGETEIEVLYYEFKADLNTYLGSLGPGARVHSMADVIAFNQANQDRVMPYFGQERMLKAQEKGPLTDESYLKALETNLRLSRQEGIDAVLQKDKLDALLAPTGQPAWLVDYINGDCGEGGCSSPTAVAGYPHITVPAGFVHGLPVGISFFSTAYTEPILLRIAYLFEQATRLRQPPRFLPTAQY